MKRFLKYFAVITLSLAMGVTPLYAKSINDLKNEQNQIKNDANQVRSRLNETQSEKSAALKEIDQLDTELDDATDELDFIGNRLEQTSLLLKETEISLSEAEVDLENQYDAYKKRVRYIYENGTVGYLQAVLSANSINDFLNRVEYVNSIVEYDNKLVKKLNDTKDLIADKLDETEKQKREIEFLASQQLTKKEGLEEMIVRKAELVEKLTLEENKYSQQLNDLENENKKFEQLIKEAEAKAAAEAAKKAAEERARAAEKSAQAAAAYTGGKIGWPVPSSGTITSPYGNRKNPISGKKEFHTGIDISASYSANIVAAEAGTVISAGWSGGYGNTIVIMHGNSLSTMYAHNSKLLVSVGDTVKKGQTISKAGSTGYSTGNHLHFEVRVNGVTTDPEKYVR